MILNVMIRYENILIDSHRISNDCHAKLISQHAVKYYDEESFVCANIAFVAHNCLDSVCLDKDAYKYMRFQRL
jgi:hypothetical protein